MYKLYIKYFNRFKCDKCSFKNIIKTIIPCHQPSDFIEIYSIYEKDSNLPDTSDRV